MNILVGDKRNKNGHFMNILVGIIVAVLLAGVIVLLVRKKQNKPMVPPAIRETGSRIRDRFSRISRGPMSNAGNDKTENANYVCYSRNIAVKI